MLAGPVYRVVLVGSDADLEGLNASLSSAPGQFQVELDRPGDGDHAGIMALEPDVAIVGASVERPLPIARQLREMCPQSQILFLVPPERLERLRAGLPFAPNLASAWTESMAAEAADLIALLREAGRISRERIATATVLGRINQRLARKSTPEQVRRSQQVLSERYLATILTQSPDAFVAVDEGYRLIAYNDAASRLLAFDSEGGEPADALALFPQDERARLKELLDSALRGEILAGIEVRLDAADTHKADVRHAELSLAPVQNQTGSAGGVSITARDISERKRAENRQRLLIDELNHRVKNTLSIVQSLAQQTFKGRASLEEERAAFAARLSTLAAAHDVLTRQAWERVNLAEVIEAALWAACGLDLQRHRIEGPKVILAPQTAVSFAMVIHELCTNAIKYGALSTSAGSIHVRWLVEHRADGARLFFEWVERGGPLVEPPTRQGFGTRMIERGLAAELAAHVQLDYRKEGLVCSMDAPLPR